MRNKLIYKYIGKVLIGYSILLVFPIIVGLIYKENILTFGLCIIFTFLLGLLLSNLKTDNKHLYAQDGFKIVTLSWIFISIIGAIPIMIDAKVSFVDAIFEAVSGFTTTGATIFKDVESLPRKIVFWRDFMHFIGGMGVLAFVMAVIPLAKNDKSMHVLKAEMPGPSVSKLVPNLKKTLYYLYGIYIGLTLIEFLLLIITKVPVFEALLLSFGTAGTGGFSPLNTSMATYSMGAKTVVTIFMFLFGVNFNIYFLILMKDVKNALKSEELRAYFFLYLFTVFILLINSINLITDVKELLISSFFNTSTFMSSTGYSIMDVNIYPTSVRIWILFIMIVSSCAGSTCGGFKVARLVLTYKTIKRDIQKLIHPNSVKVITFEGKVVDEETLDSTKTFMFLYFILLGLIIFIVGLDNFDFETTVNAVFTAFGNVGLYFKIEDFALFSPLSKITLALGMLLGRLEIYPIITLIQSRRKI